MRIPEFYHYVVEETVDPRTKDWFLVHSPIHVALIIFVYCYFVFVIGPNYMENREPYSFKTFLKLYNIFQIISNAAVVYGTAVSGWTTTYTWGCQPMDPSTTGEGYRMAVIVWWVYMLKLVDLSETAVYILRKKSRQVSFLHIYHHISTALVAWMFVKWIPGGMLSSIMLINCSVHVVMYSYYLMSTSGRTLKKFAQHLKPWITIIQMAQFCILALHISQCFSPSCNVAKAPPAVVILDLFINFYLFYNFYGENYMKKKVM